MSKNVLANSRKANSFTTSDTSHENKGSPAPKSKPSNRMEGRATSSESPAPETSPLDQPSYFASSYDTLVYSIEDHSASYTPIHDLIESYHTLNARIRAVIPTLATLQTETPALISLRNDSRPLMRAFYRDLQAALLNPFASSSNVEAAEYHLQRSQDLGTLCQTCLCAVSSIFALSPLHQLFDGKLFILTQDQDLALAFGVVLDIALADGIHLPSPSKIRTLATWIVRTQTLPGTVIRPHADKLARVIQKGLRWQRESQTILDTLKTIHNLLKSSDLNLAPRLVDFLPPILEHLCAEDEKSRVHAAHALSGFALSKLLSTPEFPHDAVKEHILAFVEHHSAREVANSNRRMPKIVAEAFASRDRLRITWCLVVAACFIVLLEDTIFAHPKAVRMCGVIFEGALKPRIKTMQTLHAQGWIAFVWAFSRFIAKAGADQKTQHQVDKVLAFVSEELKHGVGTAIVSVLLSPHDAASTDSRGVSRALKVVASMVTAEKAEPREGLLLLHHLTRSIGSFSEHSSTPRRPSQGQPSLGLFDGTILEATKEELDERVSSLSAVELWEVRKLTDKEMKEHWDTLITSCMAYAEQALSKEEADTPKELFDIWQSLLLNQGELDSSQGRGHLIATPAITSRIASSLVQLFGQLGDPGDQQRRLVLVRKLFRVARNVYAPFWCPGPAQVVLAALLERSFDLTDSGVKEAWTRLSQDIVACRIPTLLHVVSVQAPGTRNLLAQRQLWLVVAKQWSKSDGTAGWEELVPLLQVPFQAWNMIDEEVRVWTATLTQAISLAKVKLLQQTVVIQKLVEAAGIDKLLQHPGIVSTLLGHIDTDLATLPQDFLVLIDRTLHEHYPPKPEVLSACLNIIQRVGMLMAAASCEIIVKFLTVVQKSLHLWIVDEEKAMLGMEYTRVIQPFYRDTLSSLRSCTPSVEILLAISPFLVSVFSASNSSGAAAFQDFWRATFHGIELYKQYYPPDLKIILLGLADVYGGSLAEGLSLGSESQATAMITVLDSQSPPMGAAGNISEVLPESLLGVALLAGSGHRTPRRQNSNVSDASTKRQYDDTFHQEESRELGSQRDILNPESLDEDTQSRKRRRISSWVASTSFIGPAMLLSPSSLREDEVESPTTSKAKPREAMEDLSFGEDGNYDSWEVGMSSQEIEQIRQDLIS